MRMIEPVEIEFRHEMASTRKVLGRTPEAHFAWKPHARSMSLDILAGHIAEIPGWVCEVFGTDEMVFDMATYGPFQPASSMELLSVFDANVSRAAEAMKGRSDALLAAPWRMTVGERVLFELPRIIVIRSMVLNHLIHHRGQLSVYLRLKDIPLPALYGPSADETG